MEILGRYEDHTEGEKALKLRLNHADLIRIWKRCGITADYGASYASYSYQDIEGVENTASTILNELIENAAKYSRGNQGDIEILITLKSDCIYFQVDNIIDEAHYCGFYEFAREMMQCGDVNSLYIEKIKAAAESGGEASGIGLLTILVNFNAGMGFKFSCGRDKKHYAVSVQASMPVGGEALCS
jgi:hypothetical protein